MVSKEVWRSDSDDGIVPDDVMLGSATAGN